MGVEGGGADHPPLPIPTAAEAGLGSGRRPSSGRGSPGARCAPQRAGLQRLQGCEPRRDVPPQGGLQDPGAAAAGAPRPRAAADGR